MNMEFIIFQHYIKSLIMLVGKAKIWVFIAKTEEEDKIMKKI